MHRVTAAPTIWVAARSKAVFAQGVPAARWLLDRAWPSPEANLAADEALMQWCERHPGEEVLRLWETAQPFVVLGYSDAADREACLPACARLGVPVLRRCSGGGAVLQAPGCLSYALILQIDRHPELRNVSATNRWIMETHRSLLASLTGCEVAVAGVTDLAVAGRKCSGNAQKRSRTHVLFHGTFLLRLDVSLLTQVLPHPSREPGYRAGRPHSDFLLQLPLTAKELRLGLQQCWGARRVFTSSLQPWLQTLLESRYALESWHLKRDTRSRPTAAASSPSPHDVAR